MRGPRRAAAVVWVPVNGIAPRSTWIGRSRRRRCRDIHASAVINRVAPTWSWLTEAVAAILRFGAALPLLAAAAALALLTFCAVGFAAATLTARHLTVPSAQRLVNPAVWIVCSLFAGELAFHATHSGAEGVPSRAALWLRWLEISTVLAVVGCSALGV